MTKLMQNDDKMENYRVQALERAFDILNCYDFEHTSFKINELAARTGLNKATTRRLIYNLENYGFLKLDPENKSYKLGFRLFELGRLVLANFSLRDAARPHLEKFSHHLGATVLLSIPSDDVWIVIDKIFGLHTISMPSEIGTSHPITFGLQGQIFMSGMDNNTVSKLLITHPLQAYTAQSITNTTKYWDTLANVRKNGYALEVEEYMEGLMGIAAPIKNHRSATIASVLVGLPAKRYEDKTYIENVIKMLRETTAQISYEMGFRNAKDIGYKPV